MSLLLRFQTLITLKLKAILGRLLMTCQISLPGKLRIAEGTRVGHLAQAKITFKPIIQ